MNASSEEGLGNPPFSWQFVKSALDTTSCLEMVELLAIPAFSTHSSPSVAAFPAAFLLLAGNRSLDAVLVTALLLFVVAAALVFAGRLSSTQRMQLTAGSVGGAVGLLLGYGVGRLRP